MAKRRRKKPNISKAVLEQARQAATGGDEAVASETEATAQENAPSGVVVGSATAEAPRRQRRRRRDLQAVQLERRKDEGALDAEYVADLLANPTKEVSEEELRADYGFVIKDLRNMGILAAGLFVALVLISLLVL